MAAIYSANKSTLMVDGELIEGLQSLIYRVVVEQEDIRAVGSAERVDVNFGLRVVKGEIIVNSTEKTLDSHLDKQTKFQLVANLKKGEGDSAVKRTCSFDDCFVESKSFGMNANATASTTYAFNATRVREE